MTSLLRGVQSPLMVVVLGGVVVVVVSSTSSSDTGALRSKCSISIEGMFSIYDVCCAHHHLYRLFVSGTKCRN
jgi:hypothetical protein